MSTPRILVYDHDPDLTSMTAELLQLLGFDVMTCERYQEALRIVGERGLNFVVTNLGARSRDELASRAKELAEAAAPVRIGIITGWATPEITHPGIAFQVLKTADPSLLVSWIAENARVLEVAADRKRTIDTYFATISSGSWNALAALCTDDVVYHLPGEHPFARRVEGRNAFRDFARQTFEQFPEVKFAVLAVDGLPDGDTAVARYHGSWRAGDQRAEAEGAVIFGFAGDRIASIGIRVDPDAIVAHLG